MSIKLRNAFVKYSRFIVLILLVIFFVVATKTFWAPGHWDNVLNIVLQQAPFTILLAICMTVSIVLNGIDLSLGSSVALISCILGMMLQATYNTPLSIAVALALGAGIGFINGFLIAKVKISTFIATYSMQWILRGVAYVLLGGEQIFDFGPDFRPLFISSKLTFFIITAVIAAAMIFVLQKTSFGRKIYATGANVNAARISGIKTDNVIIGTYIISGLIVAIAAVMYTANLGAAEPVIGENFSINAVAATLVGGTTIGANNGKVSNAIVGAFILLTLTNGMIHLGVPSVWQQFVVGAVIVFAIVLERGLSKFSVQTV